MLGALCLNPECLTEMPGDLKEWGDCMLQSALKRKPTTERQQIVLGGGGHHDHGCVCNLLLMRGWSKSEHPGKKPFFSFALFALDVVPMSGACIMQKVGSSADWLYVRNGPTQCASRQNHYSI